MCLCVCEDVYESLFLSSVRFGFLSRCVCLCVCEDVYESLFLSSVSAISHLHQAKHSM